jgi:hypothetical protein
VRKFVQLGSSGLVLLLMMLFGGLVLWVGIPLAWLWIGSQVQVVTGSLGAAVGAMLVGVVASILLVVPVLGWLSNKHRALLLARGHEDSGHQALEVVLVTSAAVAVVAFGAWFLLFAGSSPIPIGISY